MRLLDTATKQLKTFYGKRIPKYAILSHMWGREGDEVLFRHIAGSNADRCEGELRKGYAKVEGACRQAITDGWKYIWIDTCCIDKSSSAELSEAINSMYEWYQNSEVCYVYLEDVRSDRELDGDGDREHNDRELSSDDEEYDSDEELDNGENVEPGMFQVVPFERSRWFKRGWTLQELIAPRFVVFYSKDWIDIGTKASLRTTISAVTRIRVEMLTAYDSNKASVAEKLSWAAFRKTTRVEDIAYCLMGLLGVNMPLLYGEGNRAFRRLQEEFMKVSDDNSLFAWKSRLNKFYTYDSRGMLATSPWDFCDGMNIVRSNDGAYSPYSMTNQGLQIKLPLLPIDPNLERHIIKIDPESIFKTILKCTVRDRTPTRWIVIYLKKIQEGCYQRIFPHWLDEIETPPGEMKLTKLLIPQTRSVNITRNRQRMNELAIEILPTESGFTVDGHGLVKGYKHSSNFSHDHHKVILFKHQEKCFGVAIGWEHLSNRWIPWLDFIDTIDEEQSYDDSYKYRSSRVYPRRRYLDRLSEKIPGRDWWVTILVKSTGHDQDCLLVVIDIRWKEPTLTKWWYNPPEISTSDISSGEFLLKYHNVHSDFKKEAHDWIAVYNPKVERKLSISSLYTLQLKRLVYCVQISRDGKFLATGGLTNTVVQVYNIETDTEVYTFINESTETFNFIRSICFSPDNKFIVTGDYKGCIKIRDIDAKCVHKVLNGHQNTVNSLYFSPNGHLLISGSEDSTIRIWQIPNGTSRILTFSPDHGHSPAIQSIAISPNGGLLAAGSKSGNIRIWDMVTTQLLEEFPGHGKNVHVAFTPNEKGLVSGSTDGTLKYWDITSSALGRRDVAKMNQPTITFTGHKNIRVTSIAVSNDGRWVISTLRDYCSVFWDLNDGTPQLVLETGHSDTPLLATNQAGNIFATIVNDNDVVRVWRYDSTPSQPSNPSSYVSTGDVSAQLEPKALAWAQFLGAWAQRK